MPGKVIPAPWKVSEYLGTSQPAHGRWRYYWSAGTLYIEKPGSPGSRFLVGIENSHTAYRTVCGLGEDRWMSDEGGTMHGGIFIERSADADIVVTLCNLVLFGKCDPEGSKVMCIACITDMVPT